MIQNLSHMRFRNAVVRPPCSRFAHGITSGTEGRPNIELALSQHRAYVAALEAAGVTVRCLPEAEDYPDSTFLEDVALLTSRGFVLTRPGAEARRGEPELMRSVLPFDTEIREPGTVDAGDVCQIDDLFLIGISDRTNEEGARQLADVLARWGYATEAVDIREIPTLLHLKSGLSYLGDGVVVCHLALDSHSALLPFTKICPEPEEAYASNMILVNDQVLFPAGYPKLQARLEREGYSLAVLDVSEFRKMDGGLSCLSLRY